VSEFGQALRRAASDIFPYWCVSYAGVCVVGLVRDQGTGAGNLVLAVEAVVLVVIGMLHGSVGRG
jgi:hypothetical protein